MKFKKVEISAFRIFDKPEDATFDFTTKSGDPAKFVSLYAPNGFGKTSFYDAVEWGITNNIQRFWQNKNTPGSIDALRELTNKQVNLIKRTGSTGETCVKITTDAGELKPRILKVHGRKKTNINDEEDIENKGFRQVLLSQEWIAAFLNEVDGELRYRKFVENPDLIGIDNYYKGVKSLSVVCSRKKQELISEIEKTKRSLQGNENRNLLETVNIQISNIVEKYKEQDLKPITLSTTQEQIKELRDLISKQIITYNRETELTEILNSITTAKIGDGKTNGANTFFDTKQLSGNAGNALKKIKINLDMFDKKEKSNNVLICNQKLRKQLTEEKEQNGNVIAQFAIYKKIRNAITQKSVSVKNIGLGLSDLSTQAKELARKEITQKNQRDSFIKQIEDIEDKKVKLPELKQHIKTCKVDINGTTQYLAKETPKIEEKENEIKMLDGNINEFRKVIEETNEGQYSLSIANECPDFANMIEELETKNAEIYNSRLKLKELNLNIDQQQSLNSRIEEFIKTGLSIVNDCQDSSCPLCENTYESYNQLAQRVSNNKALSNILKNLLSERSIINQKITKLTEEIKKGNERLTAFYIKKIDVLLVKKQELAKVLGRLRKDIDSKENDLKKLKQRISEYNVKLNGMPVEEYEKQLEVSLHEIVKKRDGSSKLLSYITNKMASIDEQIKNQEAQRKLFEKEIQELVINKEYVLVVTWFKDNYPNHSIAENVLTDRNVTLSEKISNASANILESETVIDSLKTGLSTLSKEGVLTQQKELEVKKQEADDRIANYIHFLKDKLEINLGQFDKKILLALLNKKDKEHKSELKKIKDLREEYQKLEKFSENLSPFLKSENVKLELKNKENELDYLTERVKPLIEEEKEKIKNHLAKKVRDFFYEDLINDLYRKIDPHPDFKSMEFKANLDADNPRLDVIVKTSDNKERRIPNLYFSTAQINILSLSIFLASALNSKEYDCIFIDDPIQSLDSINVLSTIDLLRSIVVNQDKQIILSTHDENFHNLLKKKIPDNLFKSKFLELETFGKVKKEILK